MTGPSVAAIGGGYTACAAVETRSTGFVAALAPTFAEYCRQAVYGSIGALADDRIAIKVDVVNKEDCTALRSTSTRCCS
jgi:hypothetical protein